VLSGFESAAGECWDRHDLLDAGILIGSLTITGLGFKLSYELVNLAGVIFTSFWSARIISYIMGTALDSCPVTYSWRTGGPALTKMGIPALAAHLFIFY